MALILSTNAYIRSGLTPIYGLLEDNPDLGIELFANNQDKAYMKELLALGKDTNRYLTYHEQIFDVEHSRSREEDLYSLEQIRLAIEHCVNLGIKDIVYHVNNIAVDDKQQMIAQTKFNLDHITQEAKNKGVNILVENVGVDTKQNKLLTESEFINFCKESANNVLIDIGHANANGWNLDYVIQQLQDKIKFYHLHNNDGKHDVHNLLHDGTLNMEHFFETYHKYTPNAHLTLEYNYDIGGQPQQIQHDIDYVLRKMKTE
ncbi:sugar phosphate isomerase/epimerase family protein [Staphylococcus shinii]|uniref:sugar phosphate isomerase/epimerase family protein n=1 Tax=Staphylococcus shinii TaxID=2912228 RepID=UPI00057BCFAD|nr:TIM barrel protein [Staphylococcus shinii]